MPKVTPLGESAQKRAAWEQRGLYFKTLIAGLGILSGKTQEEVYAMVGISRRSAFRLYKDLRVMRLETLDRLIQACRRYGMPLDMKELGFAQAGRLEEGTGHAKEALAGLQYRG